MSIGTFPTPLPDELFLSICARYSDRMGYQNKEAINSELFGARGKSAVVDLPSHLGHLVGNLPEGHLLTVDRLIDEHTLLPVFAPFLTENRANRLRMAISGSQCSAVHKIAGITPASVRMFDWLRYCPLCAKEDRTQYWRRIHQVSGVEVCHKHKVYLEDSDVPARNRINSAVYISAERAGLSLQSRPFDPQDPSNKILSNISMDVSWLLSQRGLIPGFDALHQAYKSILVKNDLASASGRLNCKRLLTKMNALYEPELLEKLQCAFDGEQSWSWPFRLVKELVMDKTNPPIRHLLLLQLCGYTAEEFFKLSNGLWQATRGEIIKPFGNGPWPCFNPTCKDYRKKVIRACKVRGHWANRSLPVGVFSCHCGFTYSRNGPDNSLSDSSRVDQIKEYGKVWEKALRKHWKDPKLSLNSIAGLLGVAHNTIKYQAIRLELKFPRMGSAITQMNEKIRERTTRTKTLKSSHPEAVEAHHQQWLTLIVTHPSATRTELTKLGANVYYWLLKHDRGWLLATSPRTRRVGTNRKVDWAARDSLLADEVRISATRLKNAGGVPRQVLVQSIGRDLDKKELLSKRHLTKLPLTKTVLSEVVETKVEFYSRKLKWAANYFRQERTVPAFSTLGLRANLEWKYWSVPEIKILFETVIESLRKEDEAGWIGLADLS